MVTKRTLFIATVGVIACSVTGCDPGYDYKPVDEEGKKVQQWSTKIAGVQFSTDPFNTLIGSRGTFMWLQVTNESKETVEIVGGEVESNGRTMKANWPFDSASREARTVTPGSAKQVRLFLEFGGSAMDVLGPTITWVWRVRIGTEEHILRVRKDRDPK